MTTELLARYPLQNPNHESRVIDEEAVIVAPETNHLHSLNPVATFIWKRADGQRTLDSIAEEVWQRFEVERDQARQDVVRFAIKAERLRVLLLLDSPWQG